MPQDREKTNQADSQMEAAGLPMVRRNVEGIDLGSKQHWVCPEWLQEWTRRPFRPILPKASAGAASPTKRHT